MGKKITDRVTWVGKVDWELKHFHGDELSTGRGSSYNSYLIRDKKTVLIDTVWAPYDEEFVARLKEEIDLQTIDYIIMNHNEVDHSGALPALMREIPETPIYCTAAGEKIIRGMYHRDWNFVNVKTGDTLELGDTTLTFIEAPMLHWPDTMFTYMSGENILFSSDGFGQHFASESLYNTGIDKTELYYEAEKYYTNILNLYSPQMKKKLAEVVALDLPLNLICPSHGVIWKDQPLQIVEKYQKWCDAYQENQVTIIYDTMWNSTRKMAEAIADGITKADPTTKVVILSAVKEDKSDVMTQIFRSKAILLGCPTINYGLSFAIDGTLGLMKGLRFKKKKAAAFGSYGWSGGAVKQMTEALQSCGFEIVNDGIQEIWVPDQGSVDRCRAFGAEFIRAVNGDEAQEETKDDMVPAEGGKYVCTICGFVYDPAKGDPANGIPAGTPFEKLPDDWRCPVCKVPKSKFNPED